MFDTVFEAIEARVKAYYLAGKISREDLDNIFRKYGIAFIVRWCYFIQ